jgi:Mitochondrial import protein Pam17
VLQHQDVEQFGAQMFGLDPLIVLGMTTFAFGGVGWLIGPFFGSALFNVAYRGLRKQIVAVSCTRALKYVILRRCAVLLMCFGVCRKKPSFSIVSRGTASILLRLRSATLSQTTTVRRLAVLPIIGGG